LKASAMLTISLYRKLRIRKIILQDIIRIKRDITLCSVRTVTVGLHVCHALKIIGLYFSLRSAIFIKYYILKSRSRLKFYVGLLLCLFLL